MANILLGAAARVVLPTILDKLGKAIETGLDKSAPTKPVPPIAIPAVVKAATDAVHEDPTIAVVNVKSSWWNIDNLTRLVAFIAAALALMFGREVVPVALQIQIVGVIAALMPIYEWWRSRRRTSITKAASVNVLEKPAK